jgi:hypothetical protein
MVEDRMRKLHDKTNESEKGVLAGRLALKVRDFAHPREVLADHELDSVEKRAILNAWASDACSVESRPNFCWLPGTPGPVCLSHVLAALHALEAQTEQQSAVIAATTRGPYGQRAFLMERKNA